jgi:hypothetical protein
VVVIQLRLMIPLSVSKLISIVSSTNDTSLLVAMPQVSITKMPQGGSTKTNSILSQHPWCRKQKLMKRFFAIQEYQNGRLVRKTLRHNPTLSILVRQEQQERIRQLYCKLIFWKWR